MDEYKSSDFECEPMDEQASAHEQSRQQTYNPYQHAGQAPQNHNKNDHKTLKLVALVAAVALVGSIGGSVLTTTIAGTKTSDSTATATEAESETTEEGGYTLVSHQLPDTLSSNDTGKSMTASEVYETCVNAVVGIETETTTNVFGQEAVSASSGSGFILTEDGYVITNCHVIEDADTIKVNMYNGDS